MGIKRKTAQEWSEKIKNQEESGKSAKVWCRENEESYQSFIKWRKRLRDPKQPFKDFLELPDTPETWLDISFRGVKITIRSDFERKTLLFLLQLLGNFHA